MVTSYGFGHILPFCSWVKMTAIGHEGDDSWQRVESWDKLTLHRQE